MKLQNHKNIDLVSVVILNYNTPQLTYKSVQKIEKSFEDDSPYVIVIVDNGSNKNSFIQLCNLLKDYTVVFDEQRFIANKELMQRKFIIRSKKNIGFAAGNNIGIKFSLKLFNAKYILLMNSDVFVEKKGTVESLIIEMEKYGEEIVAAMPLVWNKFRKPSNPKYQMQIRRVENYWDVLIFNSPVLKRLFRHRFNNYIYSKDMPFSKVIKARVLYGAFILLRSDFLLKIGFLDEGTFFYYEETIIGRKMQEMNVYGILDPKVCVTHLQGASSKGISKRYNSFLFFKKTESQIYYIKKYCHSSNKKIFLLFIIRFIESMIYSLFFERKISYLANLIKEFKGLYLNIFNSDEKDK